MAELYPIKSPYLPHGSQKRVWINKRSGRYLERASNYCRSQVYSLGRNQKSLSGKIIMIINQVYRIKLIGLLLKQRTDVSLPNGPPPSNYNYLDENYLNAVNQLIRENSKNTAVTFLFLPRPPTDHSTFEAYLNCLTRLTDLLYPTVLINGVSNVTTTNI